MHQLLDGPITWHPQAPRSPNHPRCPSASSEPPKITGAEIWSWNQPLWGWETNIAGMGKLQVLPGSCGRPLWWWRHACYVGEQNWTNKYNGVVLFGTRTWVGKAMFFFAANLQIGQFPKFMLRTIYICTRYAPISAHLCVYMPTCLSTPKLGRKWLSLCAWSFGAMGRALVVSLGSMLAINRHFPNPAVAICAANWHLPSCCPPFVLVPSRCCRQQVNVNGTLCWGVPEPWNAEPCRNLLACNSSTLLSCPESNDRIGCWLFSWGNLCWRSMATEYLSIFLVTFQAQSLCKLCMPQMISI